MHNGLASTGAKALPNVGIDGQIVCFLYNGCSCSRGKCIGLSIIVMMYRNTHSHRCKFFKQIEELGEGRLKGDQEIRVRNSNCFCPQLFKRNT